MVRWSRPRESNGGATGEEATENRRVPSAQFASRLSRPQPLSRLHGLPTRNIGFKLLPKFSQHAGCIESLAIRTTPVNQPIMSNYSRRTFFGRAAAVAGLATISSPIWPGRAAEAKAPSMKYAICNELFEGWPFEKVFAFSAECGYTGIEVAPFTVSNYVTDVSAARRREIRRQAETAGTPICALHWLLARTEGFHLTTSDRGMRRRTTEYFKELARFCADLGGNRMILGSPQQRNLQPDVSPEQAVAHAAEVLEGVLPVLAETGVTIGLEPLAPKETTFMMTAAEAVTLMNRIGSPHIRMMLDCKAAITEADPIPVLIRRHRDHMVHFHANDPNLQGPGFGDLDFVPIMNALADIEFDDWVSLEVFDYSPGVERLARESIDHMKATLRQATIRS
jgi:sugar phosphate isomerase/epimerase